MQKQKMNSMFVLILTGLGSLFATPDSAFKRVCVFPNWSILSESSIGRILPEDIDPFLCTHIHYAYANIDIRNMQLSPSQYQDYNRAEYGDAFYTRIMKLKDRNPKLKILISIGGWFAKSTPFIRILQSNETKTRFIENTVSFLRRWEFDGLDINWQYPGGMDTGATVDSKDQFTDFLYVNKHLLKKKTFICFKFEKRIYAILHSKQLTRAFKEADKQSSKEFVLSAYVSANEKRIVDGYNVQEICKILNYLSIATFDYTTGADTKIGYNSPLYSADSSDTNNINSSVYSWIRRGCPASKLLIGMPTYARAFKIPSTSIAYVGLKAEPYRHFSTYTNEDDVLSYYEVCEMLSNKQKMLSKVYWDHVSSVPFAIIPDSQSTDKNIWISFDDARSARKKSDYVKANGLGGLSIWSLDMDDFKGLYCNMGAFPIIEAIRQEFENQMLMTNQTIVSYSSQTTFIYPIVTTTVRVSNFSTITRQRSNQKPKTTSNNDLRKIRFKAIINRHKRFANNSNNNKKTFSSNCIAFILLAFTVGLLK